MFPETLFKLYTFLPMAVFALIGLILTVYAFNKIRSIKKFQSPFGLLLQAFFSSIFLYLSIVLLWLSLRVFFDLNTFIDKSSHYVGSIVLFSWFFGQFITVAISSNRFIAISFPLYYRNHFTNKKTKIIIGVIAVVTTSLSVFSLLDSCSMRFSKKNLIWKFPKTICGNIYQFWLQFVGCIFIVLINLILDTSTLVQLIFRKQHLMLLASKSKSVKYSINFKQDVLFFCQSFLQNINALLIIISINIFTNLIETKFAKFYFTTFAWCFSHVLDVTIVIAFNKELWKIGSKKNIYPNDNTNHIIINIKNRSKKL